MQPKPKANCSIPTRCPTCGQRKLRWDATTFICATCDRITLATPEPALLLPAPIMLATRTTGLNAGPQKAA